MLYFSYSALIAQYKKPVTQPVGGGLQKKGTYHVHIKRRAPIIGTAQNRGYKVRGKQINEKITKYGTSIMFAPRIVK